MLGARRSTVAILRPSCATPQGCPFGRKYAAATVRKDRGFPQPSMGQSFPQILAHRAEGVAIKRRRLSFYAPSQIVK